MSLTFSDLTKRLFRRFARKLTPQVNHARLSVTALEDRTVPTPVVSIAAITTSSYEGSSGAEIHITRTDTTEYVEGTFSLSGTATFGTDYGFENLDFRFEPTEDTFVLYVGGYDDSISEPTETVTITLNSGTGYTIGGTGAVTAYIHDNDAQYVSVEKIDDAVEGGATGTFRFTRIGDLSNSLTAYYWALGSATESDDYAALPGTVTFPAYSSTATVAVIAVNDAVAEYDETVGVSLLDGTAYASNYTIGVNSSAEVTIHDNETPVVSVEKNYDALEGDYNGSFWFTRLGDLSGSLTVNFTVSGTATSGTDFTSLGTTVAFGAGEWFAIVEVDAIDESISDPNETVTVTIQSGTGYTIGTDDDATLKIIDAATPFVTVEKIDDGEEGTSNGKFRFTRTGSTSGTLTVYYTVGGDATSGTDYTALSGSVTFATSSATADVTVTVTNDSIDEWLEFITVDITPDSSYEIGESGSALVSIEDNDLPEVTVETIVDAAENGGYGIIRFSRTLGDLGSPLTVLYSVGGTATSGTDYNSLSGSATFAVNEVEVDVVIAPNADMSTEGTETVTLTISSDSAYTIGTTSSASLDILEEAAGSVSGKLRKDTDGDGAIDGGETGLANRSVFLMKSGKVIAQTVTNALGEYNFGGVTAGSVNLLFDVPGNYTPTNSMGGSLPATVNGEQPRVGSIVARNRRQIRLRRPANATASTGAGSMSHQPRQRLSRA